MLAARREHEQRLGLPRHRFGQQDAAERFAERRAARLARFHDAVTAGRERSGQPRGVRALPGAIDALERNETPAGGRFGHG